MGKITSEVTLEELRAFAAQHSEAEDAMFAAYKKLEACATRPDCTGGEIAAIEDEIDRTLPYPGFQGWRYSTLSDLDIVELGGWLDPRPE